MSELQVLYGIAMYGIGLIFGILITTLTWND